MSERFKSSHQEGLSPERQQVVDTVEESVGGNIFIVSPSGQYRGSLTDMLAHCTDETMMGDIDVTGVVDYLTIAREHGASIEVVPFVAPQE